VEFAELNSQNLMIGSALAGFIVGCAIMWLMTRSKSGHSKNEDPRNHRIRELEADLRTLKRETNEQATALEAKSAEFNTAVETLQQLRATMAGSQSEIDNLKNELKGSVAKTRELRQELQDRATETVREHVRAEEAETELEVARAGSEAVMSEIARLQEERKHLTDTVRTLGENLLPADDMFDSR
jgi:predicted  nucleic acid-binding Zn-ribbon protein